MVRRKLGVIAAILLMTQICVLLMTVNPDLSGEQDLVEGVEELKQKLQFAEMLNNDRLKDVLFLSKRFNILTQTVNTTFPIKLSKEAMHMLKNQSLTSDLHLPSIYSFLPHLLKGLNAVSLALKISKGRTGVDIVLGIPTVKREVQSYLIPTLRNIIDAMYLNEREKCLIVILVAETDLDYVNKVVSQVERKFGEHVRSGLIDIISPPASFYPNFTKLKQSLGDPMERVRWRTKQNLDYSFLMMYAQPKGLYYVQLEDDIQTKKGFIHAMKSFALRKSTENKDWIVLDFCQLGFIGKMFRCAELSYLIQYFIMFSNDKPVDWLLDFMIQTKVCSLDDSVKLCKKAKDNVWIHHKPSIFQHIGTHSSLKGKVQKLKDKQFGKVILHYPHNNPAASVKSSIKHYKQFSFEKAYAGHNFFWGLLPQKDDVILINFTKPMILKKYLFRSGNVEHPSDRFYNTTIEVSPVKSPSNTYHRVTLDHFHVLGAFDDMGLAEGDIPPSMGPIKALRLYVHSESENWAILSEIMIKIHET